MLCFDIGLNLLFKTNIIIIYSYNNRMRKPGRPRKRILYEVKPEIVECILCYHSYDLNTMLPEQ